MTGLFAVLNFYSDRLRSVDENKAISLRTPVVSVNAILRQLTG